MRYDFQREDDGAILTMEFPMGECPKEIVCDDGVVAKRIFHAPHLSMFGGRGTAFNASKLNADMRSRNEAAGRRMRDSWKSVKDE